MYRFFIIILTSLLITPLLALTDFNVSTTEDGVFINAYLPSSLVKYKTTPNDSTKKNTKRDVFYANTIKTIVIDPGHGGRDGGASGSYSVEKDIVLAIAKKVKAKMKVSLPDVNVILTRETNKFIPLWKRAKIANDKKADLFISIHCNAFPNSKKIRGVETYVLGTHKTAANLEIVKRENAVIYYENDYKEHYDFDPNSSAGHILFSSYQNEHLEESFAIADKLVENIARNTGMRNKGMKQAGFRVLKNTIMPAVLVETGYLTNAGDEKILNAKTGQNQIANAIVSSIIAFKNEIENPIDDINYVTEIPIEPEVQESPSEVTSDENFETDMIFVETNEEDIVTETKEEDKTTSTVVTKNVVFVNEAKPEIIEKKPVIEFRVQLAASKITLNTHSGRWTKIGYTLLETQENGYYKYQAVDFEGYRAAMRGRHLLLQIGFKDAFVVAYKDGMKIPLTKALRY